MATTTTPAIRAGAAALAMVVLAGACGDSGTDSSRADSVVACTSLDGLPTVDVDEFFDQGNACGVDTGAGELSPIFLGIKDLECVDGSFLYWNDSGWGAVPGTWKATKAGRPPRALVSACRGE